MKISKEFKFEMAHKLENSYTCKCQNLHGHSYKAVVEFEGMVGRVDGVVVDFTQVKDEIGFVFDWLDHAIMVKDFDVITNLLKPLAASDILKKVIVTDKEPTAENIALWLFAVISEHLSHNSALRTFRLSAVTIRETATSSACITAKDFYSEAPMHVTLHNVVRGQLSPTPYYSQAYVSKDLSGVIKAKVDRFADECAARLFNVMKGGK